jgi:hypothetical protein
VHLLLCILLGSLYFQSADPQRDMVFAIFYFADPWFIPILNSLSNSPNIGFGLIAIAGTLCWWIIGFVVARLFRLIVAY